MQARRAGNAHAIVATPRRLEGLVQRRRPPRGRTPSRLPAERQTMFFAATLDGVVAKHAERSTRDPLRVEAELPIEMIGEVEHRFVGVAHEDKLDELIRQL